MSTCFFVSDLHGRVERYETLLKEIRSNTPDAVFIGGDVLPNLFASMASSGSSIAHDNFIARYLAPRLIDLKREMTSSYPSIFIILGNDDPRVEEEAAIEAAKQGIWQYIHNRQASLGNLRVFGYSCIPPTPFLLKDWERYDVSVYVDPGCIHPIEGRFSVEVSEYDLSTSTIKADLSILAGVENLEDSIFLFHAPPYNTNLDRAALDGKMIEYVPLDVHIGSIAVRRFIEDRQPLLTLHGHVHESTRLTGQWKEKIGSTWCVQSAHDGPELSLIVFDPDHLESMEHFIIE
jgi:uncharacterized protein